MGKSTRAFTLIEIVLTLGIVSVVALAVAGTLKIAFTAKKKAEAALEPVTRCTASLALLREDLESALPPVGLLAGEFLGEDARGSLGNEQDILLFYTSSGISDISYEEEKEDLLAQGTASGGISPLPVLREKSCDVRQVSFYLEEDPLRGDFSLIRTVSTTLLAQTTPEAEEEILCRRVRSLNFRYFDPESAQWLDSWDSTQQEDKLPAAVEVAVELVLEGSGEGIGAVPGQAATKWIVTVVQLLCAGSLPEEGAVQVIR